MRGKRASTEQIIAVLKEVEARAEPAAAPDPAAGFVSAPHSSLMPPGR